MAWFPSLWSIWGAIISVACSCGLIFFLAQVARDRGKRLEPELYREWGGKPSVALLRHRDSRIDAHTKARYRAFLSSKLTDLRFPSREEEETKPSEADEIYESVTAWLLTQTRDTRRFDLLFRENISYGFRRNLLGLKPLGVIISLVTAAVSTAAMLCMYHSGSVVPSLPVTVLTALVWILLICWIFIVTHPWVRITADAYGMQLLAACDALSSLERVQ